MYRHRTVFYTDSSRKRPFIDFVPEKSTENLSPLVLLRFLIRALVCYVHKFIWCLENVYLFHKKVNVLFASVRRWKIVNQIVFFHFPGLELTLVFSSVSYEILSKKCCNIHGLLRMWNIFIPPGPFIWILFRMKLWAPNRVFMSLN